MPLGVQRINAPQSAHPTPHIGFIKPLPGPGASVAEEFLSRVAAIVHPILAAHHLAVMTLEEYEPNNEFLGRNFNAGEVIQLVLRRRQGGRRPHPSSGTVSRSAVQTVASVAARTGPGAEAHPTWLPFRSVVLVMLHELAHCVQMNHRPAFWKVRNAYAAEMRELWAKGYRGEGMWGKGRALSSDLGGLIDGPTVGLEDDMPEHLCGGVYRRQRRGKKRKRTASTDNAAPLTYAERQQRRIKKKFGEGGAVLGDDPMTRGDLERKGAKKVASQSKPRVAQSNRGRELRAQAALARLGQLGQSDAKQTSSKKEHGQQAQLPFQKVEPGSQRIKQEDVSTEEEGDEAADASETESDSSVQTPGNGGYELVRVCPDSGGGGSGNLQNGTEEAKEEAENVKAERRELDDLYSIPLASEAEAEAETKAGAELSLRTNYRGNEVSKSGASHSSPPRHRKEERRQKTGSLVEENDSIACPACSLSNSALLVACCIACGCVLRPDKDPQRHWQCAQPACQGSKYVNSQDYGVCGVCGAKKGGIQ